MIAVCITGLAMFILVVAGGSIFAAVYFDETSFNAAAGYEELSLLLAKAALFPLRTSLHSLNKSMQMQAFLEILQSQIRPLRSPAQAWGCPSPRHHLDSEGRKTTAFQCYD